MADVRIPPQTAIAAQLGRATPLAKPEAVRAAQRAFFEAAMGQPQAAAPAATVSRVASPASVTGKIPTAAQTAAAEPNRLARPGSLLDIKV